MTIFCGNVNQLLENGEKKPKVLSNRGHLQTSWTLRGQLLSDSPLESRTEALTAFDSHVGNSNSEHTLRFM